MLVELSSFSFGNMWHASRELEPQLGDTRSLSALICSKTHLIALIIDGWGVLDNHRRHSWRRLRCRRGSCFRALPQGSTYVAGRAVSVCVEYRGCWLLGWPSTPLLRQRHGRVGSWLHGAIRGGPSNSFADYAAHAARTVRVHEPRSTALTL
jgi:hypothetical protein